MGVVVVVVVLVVLVVSVIGLAVFSAGGDIATRINATSFNFQ